MSCKNASEPGKCQWGVGTITGTTKTDFEISWRQDMCGEGTSVYAKRPICYPKNFCPMDSVNPEKKSSGPVVCQSECPASKEIAYFEEDRTLRTVTEYRCMSDSGCSGPFRALVKSAVGEGNQCTLCAANQYYMRAATDGKPGTCVDTCAFRNMTSPETVMNSADKYDGTHTYAEYYTKHPDMVLPLGICERPSATNVHCPYTYNSTENVTALDMMDRKAWETAMVEKFKAEFGTFFMCYKQYENADQCKIGG